MGHLLDNAGGGGRGHGELISQVLHPEYPSEGGKRDGAIRNTNSDRGWSDYIKTQVKGNSNQFKFSESQEIQIRLELLFSHSNSEEDNTEAASDEEAAKRARFEAAAAAAAAATATTSLPIW